MAQVAISNGFGQFHLRGLAEEVDRRGSLALFISGALPSQRVMERLPAGISQLNAVRRLSERAVQVAPEKSRQARIAEIPHQMSQALRRSGRYGAADALETASFEAYSRTAKRALRALRVPATIYHARAGVGGSSIRTARELGMTVLVDHSIAAPGVIDRYVPQAPPTGLFPRMWERIQRDIDAADALIVNSDFVAETFVEAGFDARRVHVAYTPVDPSFADMIDLHESSRLKRPVVTFAGTAEYRKGIDIVARIIERIGVQDIDWRIIGDWSNDALDWRQLLPDGVQIMGKLSRFELSKELATSDVFLFPSRAEGSARVAAEALRAGCQMVTTRMSGSATRDGVDGHVHSDVDDLEALEHSVLRLASRPLEERNMAMRETKSYASERLTPERYADAVSVAYADAPRTE